MRGARVIGMLAVAVLAGGQSPLVVSDPLPEQAWISQVIMEPRVATTDQVVAHAWAAGLAPQTAKRARREIRTADEKERVAIIPQPWPWPGEEASAEDDFAVQGVTLPNGAYVMAWMLEGREGWERRSNVVRFDIGPGPATAAKNNFLRIVQGEPRKARELPMVEVAAQRWVESDPDAVDLVWAGLIVDGKALTRKATEQRGHGAAMLRVGEGQKWRERWDVWTDTIDAHVPHTLRVVYGDAQSDEVKLLEATPLGDAWDAATAAIAESGTVSRGAVTGAIQDGAPGFGYRVELLRDDKVYEQRSDNKGRFEFLGIPAGDYELTCEPADKKTPLAVIEKVSVAEQPIRVDVAIGEKYAVRGKVILSTEDGGGPASGWTVRGLFVSPDGKQRVETSTDTGADGSYVLKGPFEKVSFVGVMSSPEPTPVKDIVAPKEGVDFRLTGETEEMRRVR